MKMEFFEKKIISFCFISDYSYICIETETLN